MDEAGAGCTRSPGIAPMRARAGTTGSSAIVRANRRAPPETIATLDSFRDTLEDQGEGRGVTDPVSGTVVLTMK